MKPLLSLLIKRNELLAMQSLASTDSSRYVLNGVHFEIQSNSALLVATNGMMLGILKVTDFQPDGELKEFTANVSAVKLLANSNAPILIEVHEKEVSYKSGSIRVVSDRIEGNFPTWRQVIPKTPLCDGRYNFNPMLVKKLCDMSQKLSKTSNGVMLRPHLDKDGVFSPKSPLSVFIGGREEFYGVLMPITEPEVKLPNWVTE